MTHSSELNIVSDKKSRIKSKSLKKKNYKKELKQCKGQNIAKGHKGKRAKIHEGKMAKDKGHKGKRARAKGQKPQTVNSPNSP